MTPSTLAGLLGVSAATFLAYRFRLNLASIALVQLVIVVIVALRAGFWRATVVSAVANLSVAYFIIPPQFSFQISDSQNWVALAVFEFTALLVSKLSSSAKMEAARTARLYEFARELLLLDRRQAPGTQIVELIQRVFCAAAVGLHDSSSGQVYLAGSYDDAFERLIRNTNSLNPSLTASPNPAWVQTLYFGGKPNVTLAVRGPFLTQLTFHALSSLTSVALERTWSFENESRAEAERQTEQLRAAVLDALAHEYKTPLTTIRTATTTFLATRKLSGPEEELLLLMDGETGKLSRLTTRLLQTSRLDSHKVRLHREQVDACDIARDVLDALKDQLRGHTIQTCGLDNKVEINVDRGLMVMALSQIVDNAAKYSDPGTTITIRVESDGRISVHSLGPAIAPDQLQRIFDRFYRSPALESRAAGTGLGLSVTRKIMEAHGGTVEVQSEREGNTFILRT